MILQDVFVGFQMKAYGENPNLSGNDRRAGRKGFCQQVQKRNQAGHADQRQNQSVDQAAKREAVTLFIHSTTDSFPWFSG